MLYAAKRHLDLGWQLVVDNRYFGGLPVLKFPQSNPAVEGVVFKHLREAVKNCRITIFPPIMPVLLLAAMGGAGK